MRFLRPFFVFISFIFFFSSFVQAAITPVSLKNSKILKYQNEAGKEILFKVLKRSGFTTIYETNLEAFGDEYELVGGIASSGGRPFNPRHGGLSNTIDEDNRSKIKNFLSKSTGHQVKYTVLEEWNNNYTSEWTLVSKIISKRKQSILGKVWTLVEVSTKGECTNADSSSSWAEDGAKFSEKRLIDASTGITLTFSRTWKDPPRYGYEDNSTQILKLKSFVAALSQNKKWEAKRKEELKRKAELARKKKAAELARKKKAAELARKKKAAELARKKRKAAELARKKEMARKKLLAKRKKDLEMKIFPLLSSKANILSEDLKIFLKKNPETPYLIDIATLIGKVKESQKKKQVLRLKKRLTSLRTLLVKVKGFSAFESSRIKQRKMEAVKLLEKKVVLAKALRKFLKMYISKYMLEEVETVQKIIPIMKRLDNSLKAPNEKDLDSLIAIIQKNIRTHPSMTKFLVELRKKEQLERKRKAEEQKRKELERKRKAEEQKRQELEKKRKAEEQKRQELERKRKAEEQKRQELERKDNEKERTDFENKIKKMNDMELSEIVQKKVKEKNFKEARRYASYIKDAAIRELLLNIIKKSDQNSSNENQTEIKKPQKELSPVPDL